MERDYRFDYGKGILIFLVILGHFIGDFRLEEQNEWSRLIYNEIYFFHMPVFIFITGYFYRPNREKKIVTLLAVYLLWQGINGVLNQFFDDGSFLTWNWNVFFPIFQPEWTMWYLLCVIVWFMITPYTLQLKAPFIISFIISIISSGLPEVENAFSFRRLLGFYVFFILGYITSEKKWLYTQPLWLKRIEQFKWIVIIGIILAIGIGTGYGLDAARYFMKYSYMELGYGVVKGTIIQLTTLPLQLLFCYSFLFVMPKRKERFFTHYGQWTLYLYLTHTLLIRIFKYYWGEIGEYDLLLLGIGTVGSFLYMYLFLKWKLYRVFKPLIQPKLQWLLKK